MMRLNLLLMMNRCRPRLRFAGLCLGLLCGHLLAAEDAPGPISYPGEAQIVFKGTSTLHDFVGSVPSQPFRFVLSPGAAGRPAKWSAEADVVVNGMTTFHKDRDKNMRKMFEAADHAKIHGAIKEAPVPAAPATGAEATLNLKIRGVEQSLPVSITDWKEDAQGMSFSASWDVSLKTYGLKAPSVLGLIKVGDGVMVTAKVQVSKTSTAAAAAKP